MGVNSSEKTQGDVDADGRVRGDREKPRAAPWAAPAPAPGEDRAVGEDAQQEAGREPSKQGRKCVKKEEVVTVSAWPTDHGGCGVDSAH